MTKSDSISVYRRFSAPVRGKIVAVHKREGFTVFEILITSRENKDYPFGTTMEAVSGDIYDTHRALAGGHIRFTGKTWQERF